MRHQTYGYLPSHTASQHFARYQIILLGDRSTCVVCVCVCVCVQLAQGHYMKVEWSGVGPMSVICAMMLICSEFICD